MIKGLSELSIAPVQIDALEMILIRIAYSASLPTPYEILNDVKKNFKLGQPETSTSNVIEKNDKIVFNSPEELVEYFISKKDLILVYNLKNDVGFNEFKHGEAKITLSDRAPKDILFKLQKELFDATGVKWKIDTIAGPLSETIAQTENAQNEEDKKNISDYPLVKLILAEFYGAKIETLTRKIIENEIINMEEPMFDDHNNYFEEDL